MTSPTQRTLACCKARGWTTRVVEHWNQYAGIRQDLWGLDILCLTDEELVGIQCTSAANVSARRNKLDGLPTTDKLLAAGVRVLVVGWSKRGPRGKRKLWAPVVYERIGPTWCEWTSEQLLVVFSPVSVATVLQPVARTQGSALEEEAEPAD